MYVCACVSYKSSLSVYVYLCIIYFIFYTIETSIQVTPIKREAKTQQNLQKQC